jgi:hypothetical protein
MNPTHRRQPSLDDVLARDFAELGAGETEATSPAEAASDGETSPKSTPVQPIAYNQRIDAVEDREAFVVKPPSPSVEKDSPNSPSPSANSKPVAAPGDDFDVDW